MKTIELGRSGLMVPTLAVGCMRINRLAPQEAEAFVKTALDLGGTFFDHADIYGDGECESIFAKAIGMNESVRETVILQSKCGIRPHTAFDFSKQHIIKSVEGSLSRLKTEYLDVLLLHRPDALADPQEVAEAFDILASSGKVRHFGVSNQPPALIKLLQKYVRRPFVANQLQLGIAHAGLITQTLHTNMTDDASIDRDGGLLDFCRLHDITIQPWSPFQYGYFEGTFLENEKFPQLNEKLAEMGQKYGVSQATIAVAWLLRHPAKMQPITGTMNPVHLKECFDAADITLTRDEWYALFMAAGNTLP